MMGETSDLWMGDPVMWSYVEKASVRQSCESVGLCHLSDSSPLSVLIVYCVPSAKFLLWRPELS